MSEKYLWALPPQPTLSVKGETAKAPLKRLFFVGRNYHAHAQEMGKPVDKATMQPFYFTKSPSAFAPSGTTLPYPQNTSNFHHEMELVVILGAAGANLNVSQAPRLIYGYACGLDMTRRDLQFAARDQGKPWDTAKDVEGSAVIATVTAMPGVVLKQGAISLKVNGAVKQSSNLDQLIWSVPELIADLSRYYHLEAGDVLFTGTPEGVGPVVAGDHLTGQIEGLEPISLSIKADSPGN